MTDAHSTRRACSARGAAGGVFLTLPGFLAACGGVRAQRFSATTTAAGREALPKTLTFSNWPLYIDVTEDEEAPDARRSSPKKYRRRR